MAVSDQVSAGREDPKLRANGDDVPSALGLLSSDPEFLLRQLDVHNLVITGTFTDACDPSTAFDAANRDFRVIIPRDIAARYSEEAENWALPIISLHLGLVVDASAPLAEWYALKGMELPANLQGLDDINEAAGTLQVAG